MNVITAYIWYFAYSHANDYEQKAEAYRQKTGANIELETDPLRTVFDKVVCLLNNRRSKEQIRAWQLDKMMPKRDKVALAYLYFIPKPHIEGTPLRPIVSPMNIPTTGIAKFLDKIIRPLFDKHVRWTTIIDGVYLIRRLETYVENDYLKPTAQLCTFDITDLYTMLPQEESLNVLTEFPLQHGYHKKFYRQIIGGTMRSAFTLTLANIFMWKWEKELVCRQNASYEIYGRYIDDIFLTSNKSLDKINQMLDEANQFHPNIKLVRQIGTSILFLDVYIENKNGTLETSVYHKDAAEPYIVPFKSDHPRHIFKNIIDGALTRAIRFSSTLSAFNEERRSIKLMLLYNG
ncbi:unnamed protein product [Rotaria sordida]|uniref:Reverse transcriptase domain-containing protein n=3 Tax=Rotaria sordida TaxID=392033 RepID=A0A819YIV9_9BILA|nr:unnamed protein product [Rotaria sordida]